MNLLLLPILASGCFLLTSLIAVASPKITATETGQSGPGPQTIQGGNVTFSLSAEGKPLSYTIGNGTNLLRPNNPGPGFYLISGNGTATKKVRFVSAESQDGKLILTGEDKTRVTLAVNAGDRFISFRLEKIEDIPMEANPILHFQVNFELGILPESFPLNYMCSTGGRDQTNSSLIITTWPYLSKRADNDPLGGFAFFVPMNDEEHNEALLRLWTEEKMPHPKVEGEWTYERAKQWAEEWNKIAQDTTKLMISAEKPEDLDPLIDFAKKLKVKRVYMHTDTWREQYWLRDIDPLSVNTKVFPRGEEDLKAFIDKLRANGIGAMMHTLGYGVGPEGSKYLGVGKKTDRRIANWGKGKLEEPISATDTTILFRPDPGVKFPASGTYPPYWRFPEVRIGDELIPCQFKDTDQPVWKLTNCVRGPSATSHEGGSEVVGIMKPYGQNYYPDSKTDLPEITAKDYAEFFNRLGVVHHEFDGAECHNDVPWGFSKWAMFVYQNTELPMTSNTSSGRPNPWDLMYRFKTNGAEKLYNKGSASGCGSGAASLTLERDGRLATSPIENHFSMGLGTGFNTPGYVFEKPEPMFGIFPHFIHDHGLAELIAEQFTVWREISPKLTPNLRQMILETYTRNERSHHRNAKIVYEARRAGSGYELQPFTIMTRGPVDANWTTVQEFGSIMPRQYMALGMRVKLDNPFGRQAPQFLIRVMNGYTDDAAAVAQPAAPQETMSEDLQGYLATAGPQATQATPASAATPAPPTAPNADPFRLQPKAEQMRGRARHVFNNVGPALEVSLDNLVKEEVPTASPVAPAASPTPAPTPSSSPQPTPGSVAFEQQAGFPFHSFKGNSLNAPGLAMTVTGDGSGAVLGITLGYAKHYLLPIDFTGRREIFIPTSEASLTVPGFQLVNRSSYGEFQIVQIGFRRVPANTHAKILIEDLRMAAEKPASIKNPVIHAGQGTLAIQGEVKSSQYLWYQGGDKVGVYDKNWNHQTDLPVVKTNYEVEKGFSEYWIEGEAADPAPWFDVQFITKGEAIPVPAN